MEESAAIVVVAVAASAVIQAIIVTAIPVVESVVLIVVVKSVSILEITRSSAVILIVKVLETRFVISAPVVVVGSELTFSVVPAVIGPAATAASRVRP